MRKKFPMPIEEHVDLDEIMNDRMRQLCDDIATYREKIALTTDLGLRATFAAVLELTEHELAAYRCR